jgi:hypothetical protein
MGYDGNLNVLVAKAGMDTAEELLNYIVNKAA